MEGNIFNIQKFSVNDGGGIRTVVFFKGCPLRCAWCSNPESQGAGISRMFWNSRCIGCGRCFAACPLGIGNDMAKQAECRHCLDCVKACPSGALEQVGKIYRLAEVLREVEKDVMYYSASGGGVTLSGGEPLQQWEFAAAILKACKDSCINTAIETTGLAPFNQFEIAVEHCDRILYDVKHMDSSIHKRYTGVGNEIILDNLKKIRRTGKEVIIRIPLLHGVNDDWENMERTAALALECGIGELHLLPYHRYGEPKYTALGRSPWKKDAGVPETKTTELVEKLSAYGLKIVVGG